MSVKGMWAEEGHFLEISLDLIDCKTLTVDIKDSIEENTSRKDNPVRY